MGRLTKAQTRMLERALDYLERGHGELEGRYVLARVDTMATTAAHFVPNGEYGRERTGAALQPVSWHGSGLTVAEHGTREVRNLLERDGFR